MKTLKENALLVTLHVSAWVGCIADKKATNLVERTNNAVNAGSFNKLLVNPDAMKGYQQASRALRKWFHKNTLPWDDSGHRILKVTELFTFEEEFKEKKREFDTEVMAFLAEYPTLVSDATNRLGSLYESSEYPTVDELRTKFGVKYSVSEITSDEDLRVQVQAEQVEQLKELIKNDLNDNIDTANSDIFDRARGVIGRLIEKMKEEDPKFNSSIVGNIGELVSLMPRLNVTNNPTISAMCDDMKTLLVPVDTLKKSEQARENVLVKAENMLTKYNLA